MAGECNVTIIAEVLGLDKEVSFSEKFAVTTTPTKATLNTQIQATANTEEALNLCGISTVELVIIKAVANDLDIDCDFSSAFDADIHIPEGETRVVKPSGTLYIKNNDIDEACTVSVLIIGSA